MAEQQNGEMRILEPEAPPAYQDAAQLLLRWGDEMSDRPNLFHVYTVTEAIKQLDPKTLLVDTSKRSHIISAIFGHFTLLTGINPTDAGSIVLDKGIGGVDTLFGKMNPQMSWSLSIIEQSQERDKTNINENGGAWGIAFRPDRPSVNHGATELLQTLGQLWIETAQALADTGDESIGFTPAPPSADEQFKMAGIAGESRSFLGDVTARTYPWLNRDFMHHIGKPYSTGKATHNPLAIPIHGDETIFRDVDSPCNFTTRIYREGPTADTAFFADLPTETAMSMTEKQLEGILTATGETTPDMHIEHIPTRNGGTRSETLTLAWQRAGMEHETSVTSRPIFTIASGRGPSSQSAVYDYAKNGDPIVFAYYNQLAHRIELSPSHPALDGDPFKPIAFACARAVGAHGRHKPEDIRFPSVEPLAEGKIADVELHPPLQNAPAPDKKDIAKLNTRILNALEGNTLAGVWWGTVAKLKRVSVDSLYDRTDAYSRDPVFSHLIHSLGLSHVVLRTQLDTETVGHMQQAAQTLQEYFIKPIIKDMYAFLAEKNVTVNADTRIILEKVFVGMKMSALKFFDFIAEVDDGPYTSCKVSRLHRNARVLLTLIPSLPTAMTRDLATYHERRIADANAPLFTSDDHEVIEAFTQLIQQWIAEYALGELAFPTIDTLQASVNQWRPVAELLAGFIRHKLLKKTKIEGQDSHMGELSAVLDGETVFLESFHTAQTGQKFETEFTTGRGTMTETYEDDTATMIVEANERLTPDEFESLPMETDPAVMETIIRHIILRLHPDDGAKQQELTERALHVSSIWGEYTRQLYPTLAEGTRPSNAVILTTMLSDPESPFVREPEFAKNHREALQTVVLGGMYAKEQRFIHTLGDTAKATSIYLHRVNATH